MVRISAPVPIRPRLHPHARQPLRLDRAAQPARLPRGRDQRGDGLRARRRRLLLLRHPRGRLAEPLVQRPHRAAGGELPRADRGSAGAAHLRGGRRRGLGGGRGPRSTPAARRSCSPTSTTSTTTATRPTSPATRWSSPATTRRSPSSPTPASRSCRRRPAREPRQGPPQRPPRLPARRPHVHGRRTRSSREQLRARSRRRSSGRRRQMLEPTFGEFSGLAAVERLAAEAGTGPRPPRTGSGAPASATR